MTELMDLMVHNADDRWTVLMDEGTTFTTWGSRG